MHNTSSSALSGRLVHMLIVQRSFAALFSQTPSSVFTALLRMERNEDEEEEEVLFRAEPVLVSAYGTC